jgi:transcriptional regulator with XRE-family HTH domain
MDFKAWLSAQRRQARITQRELAKKCGLSPGYLALLESGLAEPPPLKTCKRLARALGANWAEAGPIALAGRLGTWLKREGLFRISKSETLEIAERLFSEEKDVLVGKAKLQNGLPPSK